MSTTPLSLRDVARVTGGRVVGDPDRQVRGVSPLRDAGPDDLGLLSSRRYAGAARKSRAAAFLVSRSLVEVLDDDRPRVEVDDAQAALIPLLRHTHPAPEPEPGVHPTAVLGSGVSLGPEVSVGPYAVLDDGVVVADRARIGAHVTVGRGSRLGEDSVLHPGVVLYPRTVVGRRVVIHAGARIGVDGFGYARTEDGWRKIPQVGRVVVEDDVEIGANSCIDRGSIGDTVVGAGSKIDNLVHLGHNVRLGERCAFAAQMGVAGSVVFGSDVVAGGQVGVSGHLEIGDGVQLAAQSGVTTDVDPGSTVMGYPARDMREYLKASAASYRVHDLIRTVRRLESEVAELGEGREEGEGEGDG